MRSQAVVRWFHEPEACVNALASYMLPNVVQQNTSEVSSSPRENSIDVLVEPDACTVYVSNDTKDATKKRVGKVVFEN